jgi:transposase
VCDATYASGQVPILKVRLVVEICGMLMLSDTTTYYIYLLNTDMRKGFDSLSGIVSSQMQFNPLSNDVYIFINRRRTQMKLLHWEGDGFGLYYKRLERGTYELPKVQENKCCVTVDIVHLQKIFKGVSVNQNRQRKRYQHQP